VNALAPVPESATVISGVGTVPVFVIVNVCAAGLEPAEYPAVTPAKVNVAGVTEILGAPAALTVKLTVRVTEVIPAALIVTVAV
jgi:hypothetical protein